MIDFSSPEIIFLPERKGTRGSTINPVELAVYAAGSGPAVVLCHGFPEIAFSWRHQISALVDAGFQVIVPDLRGFGDSDAPEAANEYSLEHLTADLVAILDQYGIKKAVFAGHDWGGFVVWCMPVAYPERTAGVIGVNTPYISFPTTAMLRSVFNNDDDLYILWFQKEGVAEKVLDQQADLVFEKIMRGGIKYKGSGMLDPKGPRKANPFIDLATRKASGPIFLTEEEKRHFVKIFQNSGFRGGINWYRNIDRNNELFPEIGKKQLNLPCLMITAEWDFALPPALAKKMPLLCSDLKTEMLKECGHWTQQEKPEVFNRIMISWLQKRFL
ncbi:MAG: alpha/beta hydrolase [SAR324 cluster bacterium]|nr:alpha/beta hydrolase [SAR324 cluster bacterium]